MKQYIQFFSIFILFNLVSFQNVFANNYNELDSKSNSYLIDYLDDYQEAGTKVVDNYRKQKKYKKEVQKTDVADSNNRNKIKKIWENSSGILNVTANLIDTNIVVKINAYNMLGKKVAEVFSGTPTTRNGDGEYHFTSDTATNLPKGVYVLVIQSSQFRIAEKFIITQN